MNRGANPLMEARRSGSERPTDAGIENFFLVSDSVGTYSNPAANERGFKPAKFAESFYAHALLR